MHPYLLLDGVWLKRSWGEVRNITVLVAGSLNAEGFREVAGVMEGMKEDAASWRNFLRYLQARGLAGVHWSSSTSVPACWRAGRVLSAAQWQHCLVHFYRNVFSVVPTSRVKEVAALLKAIHRAGRSSRRPR